MGRKGGKRSTTEHFEVPDDATINLNTKYEKPNEENEKSNEENVKEEKGEKIRATLYQQNPILHPITGSRTFSVHLR